MATEFPYPPKPWYDGQEVAVDNDDGTVTVATYEQQNNTWHIKIKYAEVTDEYIYTDHVLTVNDDLPVERLKEAYAGVDTSLDPGDVLPTQESVNNALAVYAAAATRKGLRTEDLVSFEVDARSKGTWVSKVPGTPSQLPDPGCFYAFHDSIPVKEFGEVNRLVFAGQDEGLAGVKVGDYLIVQANNDTDYGGYVITSKEIIGQLNLGVQWWASFHVKPVRQGLPDQRTKGDFQTDEHCSVKVTRPVYLIPQIDQPVVPAEGYIWFKSDTHELYVSTRGDTDPQEPGVDQWVKIGPSSGGGGGGLIGKGDIRIVAEDGLESYGSTKHNANQEADSTQWLKVKLGSGLKFDEDGAIIPDIDLSGYAATGYVDNAVEQIQAAVTTLDSRVGEVLSLNLNDFVSNSTLAQRNFVNQTQLESRIASIDIPELPGGLITETELENRISQLPTVPATVATTEDIQQAIANIEIPDLPANLITEHELEHRLTQLPAPQVTPHDVALAAQAVDAKFDMLRSAISEATDFDTLKVRLLAVLG